jgi:hypothetical protein
MDMSNINNDSSSLNDNIFILVIASVFILIIIYKPVYDCTLGTNYNNIQKIDNFESDPNQNQNINPDQSNTGNTVLNWMSGGLVVIAVISYILYMLKKLWPIDKRDYALYSSMILGIIIPAIYYKVR